MQEDIKFWKVSIKRICDLINIMCDEFHVDKKEIIMELENQEIDMYIYKYLKLRDILFSNCESFKEVIEILEGGDESMNNRSSNYVLLNDEFIGKMKAQRLQLGIKQAELCKKINIPTYTFSKFEKGLLKSIDRETLEKLAFELEMENEFNELVAEDSKYSEKKTIRFSFLMSNKIKNCPDYNALGFSGTVIRILDEYFEEIYLRENREFIIDTFNESLELTFCKVIKDQNIQIEKYKNLLNHLSEKYNIDLEDEQSFANEKMINRRNAKLY